MRKPRQATYRDRTPKKCNTCDKGETEVDFYLRYRHICKKCHNESSRATYKKRKEKAKEGYW